MNLFDFVDDPNTIDQFSINNHDYEETEMSGVDDVSNEDTYTIDQDSPLFELGNEPISNCFHLDGNYNNPEVSDQEMSNVESEHIVSHKHYSNAGTISFTGNGRCRVCGCGKWAGFGDTCANCGHFYNKHI